MKPTTRRVLGIAAASALLIGAAGGVFAHGGYGPGWGGHHGMMGGPRGMGAYGGPGWMMGGDPAAYTDQQLTQLKTTLGITPEQEAAWNAYAEAEQARAGIRAAHHEAMFGQGTVTPEQRLSFHEQGLAQMQKVTAATRNLYAALTPEQQAKADGLLVGPRCAFR